MWILKVTLWKNYHNVMRKRKGSLKSDTPKDNLPKGSIKKKANEHRVTSTGGNSPQLLAKTPKGEKVDIQALVFPLWAPLCLL